MVIPALDEVGQIAGAIQSVQLPDEDVEILVVDGGSRDETAERARAAGASVLASGPGRARQLQAGWRATSGDVVLFLHADTRLEPGWAAAVRRAMLDPSVVGGAFRFRFDQRNGRLRFVEFGVRLRVGLFAMPYGDQAIFVRRRVLEAMGGIPEVALMEDLDLVTGMKAHGRVIAIPLDATTSARRYLAGGVLRTMGRHWLALAGWRLGIDRQRVARWSRR